MQATRISGMAEGLRGRHMPNRTLKESIRESESINQLSHAAECTFYRLITIADDYGLFKAHPRLLNRFLFPLRNCNDSEVIDWIDEVANAGMVTFYIGDDGKPYGMFTNWQEYNTPRNTKSKYPQPTEETTFYDSLQAVANICMQVQSSDSKCPRSSSSSSSSSRDTSACNPKQSKAKPKTFTPPTPDEMSAYAKERGYPEALGRTAHEYYAAANWHDSKGSPVKSWKQKMLSVWLKPENKARADPGVSNNAVADAEYYRKLDELTS